MAEAEIREEVMQEMGARMMEMQKGFAKRMRQAVRKSADRLATALLIEHTKG